MTTAYYLSRGGFSIELHERTGVWGGLLQTHHTEFGMIEQAANGILKTQTLVNLCQDMGISLVRAGERSRKRYIYRGFPKRWPLGGVETLRLLPSVFSLFVNRASREPKPGQSLSHWVRENFNSTVLDYLVAPALQGVYAGDPDRMSARLVMDRFFHPVRKRKMGKLCTVAPEGGMGELIGRLVDGLRKGGVILHLNSPYALPRTLQAPHVLCTGVQGASELIKDPMASLSQKLSRVDRYSLVSTTVFFKRSSEDIEGFGCLFPRPENFFHLGVLYNDCIFGNRSQDFRSETWIGGGALSPEFIHLSDGEILARIEKDRGRLQKTLGIEFSQISRWPGVLPAYGPELEEALEELKRLERRRDSRLYFNGNYLGGVGLSRILERACDMPRILMESE